MSRKLKRAWFVTFVIVAGASPRAAFAKTYPFCGCDGGYPSVSTNGNGRCPGNSSCVMHPEIVLSFWQDSDAPVWWNPNAIMPPQQLTYSQYIGNAMALVNSPYFAKLQQYDSGGSISRPRLSPFAPVFTGGPPAPGTPTDSTQNFTTNDVLAILDQEMASGQLPPPVANDGMIYVLVMPQNSNRSSGCGTPAVQALGCNFSGRNALGRYRAAYVFADGDVTLSHEVVENVAAFEGAGLTTTGCPNNPASTQISDVCRCDGGSETQNGIQVQGYWSAQDGECVIPETWGELTENGSGGGGGWVNTRYMPRQAYGGGGGVVFTDGNDDAWFYDSRNGVASQFGGPGSEFAAGTASDGSGGAVIAGVTTDPRYGVNYYDVGTHAWSAIGAPNGPVTSVTVTGQGVIVVTDPQGQPWYYVPSNPREGWVKFGGPGDQFIAIGNDIYALNPSKTDLFVYRWQNLGAVGSWTEIRSGQAYMEILGCSDSDYYATAEAGQRAFWPSGYDYGTFIYSFDFGISGLARAPYVASGYTVWGQSASVSSQWFEFGSYPVGRLISGNLVYATNCPGAYPCVTL